LNLVRGYHLYRRVTGKDGSSMDQTCQVLKTWQVSVAERSQGARGPGQGYTCDKTPLADILKPPSSDFNGELPWQDN